MNRFLLTIGLLFVAIVVSTQFRAVQNRANQAEARAARAEQIADELVGKLRIEKTNGISLAGGSQ